MSSAAMNKNSSAKKQGPPRHVQVINRAIRETTHTLPVSWRRRRRGTRPLRMSETACHRKSADVAIAQTRETKACYCHTNKGGGITPWAGAPPPFCPGHATTPLAGRPPPQEKLQGGYALKECLLTQNHQTCSFIGAFASCKPIMAPRMAELKQDNGCTADARTAAAAAGRR